MTESPNSFLLTVNMVMSHGTTRMKRLSLDTATTDIKQFVRGLPIAEGLELELEGEVVCTVFPPHAISPDERAALVARARELLARSRERNKGTPARVLERKVQETLDEVRGRKQ